jgi:hypothetical protein
MKWLTCHVSGCVGKMLTRELPTQDAICNLT